MAASAKFTLLPPDFFSSQPPAAEMTLRSLIETQDRMADEAREALPYLFDECTYAKGPLRQAVWSCLDCGEKGVCYGCSISCHSDHKLVELWTRRDFRCDCPTTSMCSSQSQSSSSFPSSSSTKPSRFCTLNSRGEQPLPINDANKYSQNFSGKFCRCGRDYDPETEDEAMICCIACEDWFHESCLNLRPKKERDVKPDPTSTAPESATGAGADGEEEEDEETDVLIPSETYDGLICAACVGSSPVTSRLAGSEGWMTLEPDGAGGWKVVGRLGGVKEEEKVGEEVVGASVKRARDEGEGGQDGEEGRKKPRLQEEMKDEVKGEELDEAKPNGSAPASITRAARDVFLANGVREKLKSTLDGESIASLPFPLIDTEIYEPPKDEDEDETLEQVTNRVIGSLPRVQAIEALHGYQAMKDRLVALLERHAQSGETVRAEEVQEMFEDLRANRR